MRVFVKYNRNQTFLIWYSSSFGNFDILSYFISTSAFTVNVAK